MFTEEQVRLALSDTDALERIFSETVGYVDLGVMKRDQPKLMNDALQLLLTEQTLFDGYFRHTRLLALYVEAFPEHSDKFLSMSGILKSEASCRRWVESAYHLGRLLDAFPHKTDELVQLTRILDDHAVFQSMTATNLDIQHLFKTPKLTKQFLDFLIQHPDEFARIIPDNKAWNGFADRAKHLLFMYSQYNVIFAQKTAAKALVAVKKHKSTLDIQRTARYLAIGYKRNAENIRKLPVDLILHTAAAARDPNLHSLEEAKMIARSRLDLSVQEQTKMLEKSCLDLRLQGQTKFDKFRVEHQTLIANSVPKRSRIQTGFFILFHRDRTNILKQALEYAKTSRGYAQIIQNQITQFETGETSFTGLESLPEQLSRRLTQHSKYWRFHGYHGYYDLLLRLRRDIQDSMAEQPAQQNLPAAGY